MMLIYFADKFKAHRVLHQCRRFRSVGQAALPPRPDRRSCGSAVWAGEDRTNLKPFRISHVGTPGSQPPSGCRVYMYVVASPRAIGEARVY